MGRPRKIPPGVKNLAGWESERVVLGRAFVIKVQYPHGELTILECTRPKFRFYTDATEPGG